MYAERSARRFRIDAQEQRKGIDPDPNGGGGLSAEAVCKAVSMGSRKKAKLAYSSPGLLGYAGGPKGM